MGKCPPGSGGVPPASLILPKGLSAPVRPSHRHRRLSAAQAKAIVLSIAEAAGGFDDSVVTKTAVANVSLTVAFIKLL